MNKAAHLPDYIFFTGVPGSRWSGVAQLLEQHPDVNISDRRDHREYKHSRFGGHVGSYFGPGMEFDAKLNKNYLKQAWRPRTQGTKVVKSHHWAYMLDKIRAKYSKDWIVLVYRPDLESFGWWLEAGGFNISYPSYRWYRNYRKMLYEIQEQNSRILEFSFKEQLQWSHFTEEWIEKHFRFAASVPRKYSSVLVAIYKGSDG